MDVERLFHIGKWIKVVPKDFLFGNLIGRVKVIWMWPLTIFPSIFMPWHIRYWGAIKDLILIRASQFNQKTEYSSNYILYVLEKIICTQLLFFWNGF